VSILRWAYEGSVVNDSQASPLGNPTSRVVDLLLVTFNSAHLLERLRHTLMQAERHGVILRLLAVDNASSDSSAAILRRSFGCEVLIQNRENVGFGRANNQLLEHCALRICAAAEHGCIRVTADDRHEHEVHG
jgi:GT2 family glycosyltransferase